MTTRLVVEKLGHRGEGVVPGPVYVPYGLPGDTIAADVDGDRGRIIEILTPSADRVPAFCPHYTVCGGCAVQTLAERPYAQWKRSIVAAALSRAGVEADVAPLINAHGDGRRRATFHARAQRQGSRAVTQVGFMQARAHAIVDIDACPILAPAMLHAPRAARAVADALSGIDKPLDIDVTATLGGLDVNIRGCGRLPFETTQRLLAAAKRHDLARIANHGSTVFECRAPQLRMGRALVTLPSGAFLQATEAADQILGRLVCAAASKARRVVDLFAGVGTFALRLAETTEVLALDADRPAMAALENAAKAAPKSVKAEVRDLMRRPMMRGECDGFDAAIFDPPRAGASAQAMELAASGMPTIVAVSCNAATFGRDAKILVDGGYAIEAVTPVDQFRYSPHVEIVGVFRRKGASVGKRRLLG